VLTALARHARVIICGAISQYNSTEAVRGPSNYLSLLVNHASMTGFVVSDYGERYAEGAAEMARWLAAGELISREEVAHGLETCPDTLLRLFSGENTGKLVLEL
jgi:NADPH-dependent curcumin reductase